MQDPLDSFLEAEAQALAGCQQALSRGLAGQLAEQQARWLQVKAEKRHLLRRRALLSVCQLTQDINARLGTIQAGLEHRLQGVKAQLARG
jgi:hypothetical protein